MAGDQRGAEPTGLETACGPYVPAPPVPEKWTLKEGTFIVLGLRDVGTGHPIVTAVPILGEPEAHDVAEAFLALGTRAFFIDTDPEGGGDPTIEEYHGG